MKNEKVECDRESLAPKNPFQLTKESSGPIGLSLGEVSNNLLRDVFEEHKINKARTFLEKKNFNLELVKTFKTEILEFQDILTKLADLGVLIARSGTGIILNDGYCLSFHHNTHSKYSQIHFAIHLSSLAKLKELEQMLRARFPKPDYLIASEFIDVHWYYINKNKVTYSVITEALDES